MNGPVQLGFTLLQGLQGSILFQGHDDRLYGAVANDHLMIGDVITETHGMVTHTVRILRGRATVPP